MCKAHRGWNIVAALVVLVPAVVVPVAAWHLAQRPAPIQSAVGAHEARPSEHDMVLAGAVLFNHEWQPNDPLCAGGDGLGPVFNATSCAACHRDPGPGGSGGLEHNVTNFTVRDEGTGALRRQGVVHLHSLAAQETLQDVDPRLPRMWPPSLEQLTRMAEPKPVMEGRRVIRIAPSTPPGVHLSQRNTPALFGAGLIDALPDEVIATVEVAERENSAARKLLAGRALRLPNGRIGRFGWKAQMASLGEFVQAACANELGLGNPGHEHPRPLSQPDYPDRGLDLTLGQCQQLTAFIASLPRPEERLPAALEDQSAALKGKLLFESCDCVACHKPNLGPIAGIYSDLLLHDMGRELEGGGAYGQRPVPDVSPGNGPKPSEWRTPPLWGVADSAPYLHDGRARDLKEAISQHGGQGGFSARNFLRLNTADQGHVIAFLKTLQAPVKGSTNRAMPYWVACATAPRPTVETVPVVVALVDIPRFATLTPDMLTTREFPKDSIPAGAANRVEDVADRVALSGLVKDEPIIEGKLALRGTGRGMAPGLPVGKRAFIILVSAGAVGFIQPGNKVDVLLAMSGNGDHGDEMLLESVEVLALDQQVDRPNNDLMFHDDRSVTLLVTPEQVDTLDQAQRRGTLHLSLSR
jgi:Flp pilus assembly protein CpaB